MQKLIKATVRLPLFYHSCAYFVTANLSFWVSVLPKMHLQINEKCHNGFCLSETIVCKLCQKLSLLFSPLQALLPTHARLWFCPPQALSVSPRKSQQTTTCCLLCYYTFLWWLSPPAGNASGMSGKLKNDCKGEKKCNWCAMVTVKQAWYTIWPSHCIWCVLLTDNGN